MIEEYKTLYDPIIAPAGSYVSRNRFENILQDLFEENTNIVNKLNEVIRKVNNLDPEDVSDEIEKIKQDVTDLQQRVESLTVATATSDGLITKEFFNLANAIFGSYTSSQIENMIINYYTASGLEVDDVQIQSGEQYTYNITDRGERLVYGGETIFIRITNVDIPTGATSPEEFIAKFYTFDTVDLLDNEITSDAVIKINVPTTITEPISLGELEVSLDWDSELGEIKSVVDFNIFIIPKCN